MRYHNESRTGRPKRPAKAHGEAPLDTAAQPSTEVCIPNTEVANITPDPPVHSGKRLTTAEEVKILKWCKVDGMPQHLAAKALGRAESTISECLARYEETGELALAALKNASLDAAIRWAEIARTSRRHDAAKDLLLHAGVIKPLESEAGGAKVQILIGQPGAPVTITTPQVIDAVKVSSTDDPQS